MAAGIPLGKTVLDMTETEIVGWVIGLGEAGGSTFDWQALESDGVFEWVKES